MLVIGSARLVSFVCVYIRKWNVIARDKVLMYMSAIWPFSGSVRSGCGDVLCTLSNSIIMHSGVPSVCIYACSQDLCILQTHVFYMRTHNGLPKQLDRFPC